MLNPIPVTRRVTAAMKIRWIVDRGASEGSSVIANVQPAGNRRSARTATSQGNYMLEAHSDPNLCQPLHAPRRAICPQSDYPRKACEHVNM